MVLISIKRSNTYQHFQYDGDMNIPVTTLIKIINNQKKILDIDGNEVKPISWSCSCLQGLCGSCAMLINDIPQLACKAFLNQVVKDNKIKIEALSKFPTIKDLKVDRNCLYNAMKESKQWLNNNAKVNKNDISFEYEMSQCLMCGCCLEACPNYINDAKYCGIHIVVSSAKLVNQESDKKHLKEMKDNYKIKFYPNCVKSLLCQEVCPMKIPTQRAISKMNKNSIWWLWQLLSKK